MEPVCSAEEQRAGLAGVVADGDHVIEFLPIKCVDVLLALRADVDAHLPHHRNGFGPNHAWGESPKRSGEYIGER